MEKNLNRKRYKFFNGMPVIKISDKLIQKNVMIITNNIGVDVEAVHLQKFSRSDKQESFNRNDLIPILYFGKYFKFSKMMKRNVLKYRIWLKGEPIPAPTLIGKMWEDDASQRSIIMSYDDTIAKSLELYEQNLIKTNRENDTHGNTS